MTACPVCRADHIGSLMRPRALKDAYKARAAGTLDAAGFERALDAAIGAAVSMQEAAGLGAVTDGEFRRRSWFAGFVDAVDGLTHKDTYFKFLEGADATVSVPVPHATGPIRRTRGIATGEYEFARRVARLPVKITLPAPSVMHMFRGPEGRDPGVYPDEADFWRDLVAVYRAEIAALGELGCAYVQIDDVPPALLCDEGVRRRVAAWGWDWRGLLDRYIDAVNQAVAGRPPGMKIGLHLCRGNFRGHYIGSGGYEPVAEALFGRSAADQFLLEYDDARAGDFAPLRFVPRDKCVVLGLVSSKTARLEEPDALRRRLDEAARYVPMERLALSPQCGFGTTVGGAPMTEDDQRAKLALVGRVAARVWG